MISRAAYKRMQKLSPAAQWWEKRYLASGYVPTDRRTRQEVLRLIEWAIKRHREQDQRETQ